MRMEVHVHADIPILEGVARKQLEMALSPWLDYLDADSIEDVKSLEPEEPGIEYDEPNRMLYLCWTGEIGRSFQKVLEAALETLGPYAAIRNVCCVLRSLPSPAGRPTRGESVPGAFPRQHFLRGRRPAGIHGS